MRLLPVREKAVPNGPAVAGSTSAGGARSDIKELLGKEFRLVKNGLDPDQVAAFLESVSGNTEAALKRLEHFSAMQKATQTMDLMLAEARQLSEQLRSQSRLEAQVEKDQMIAGARRQADEIKEEAARQAAETTRQARDGFLAATNEAGVFLRDARERVERLLKQTSRSYADAIDGTRSVLQEAIARAREIEEAACRKAEEKAVLGTEAMRREMHVAVEETQKELDAAFDKVAGLPVSHPSPLPVPVALHGPVDLTLVEAEVTALVGAIPGNGSGHVASEAELISSVPAAPVAAVPAPSDPPTFNTNVYEGEVALVIPEGAGQLAVLAIRRRLLGLPALRISMESGDETGRTILRLFLGQPTALPSALRELPGVADVQEASGREPSGKPDRRGASPPVKTLTVVLTNKAP
ncbi:MAG: DivIVA domain-containing protein [Chloroflexi bacterium]|nr:DivIVA domain-containing protein [Chloroflexota bacterium]